MKEKKNKVTVSFINAVATLLLQPQKQKRQATPKKTQNIKKEDDEYAGSTDVDEPGLYRFTVK